MTPSLLDPITIAQLGNLSLRARRILDGLYAGRHLNRNRGHSQDFSEHRPYNPGDDLRSLDWKVLGRTDRLVIKQFDEQTSVSATVLLDDSASMNFSWGGRPSKLEYAKTMAAAIGYLVVSQHDAIGLVSQSYHLPPGNQRAHLTRFIDGLSGLQGNGVWNLKGLPQVLLCPAKKRGFVVVFSDLMAKEEDVLSTLRVFQASKHEVMVFQILDPAERDLPFDGSILFEDLETKETLKTDPQALRAKYRSWVQAHLASFAHMCRSAGMDYLTLTTDTPFDKGMGAYLSRRGARV